MPDVVTPAHFDILENLYVQVGNSPVSRNLVVPPIFQGKIPGNELNFEFAMTAEWKNWRGTLTGLARIWSGYIDKSQREDKKCLQL